MSIKLTSDRGDTLDRRRFILMLGGGAALVGLAACGDDGNDGTSPSARTGDETAPEAGGAEVVIPPDAWDPANADIAYSPNVVTIKVGDTVTWRNTDSLFHTVTSGMSTGEAGKPGTPDGIFDSGEVQAGEMFQHTFTEAGTFDYFCTPHPWMIGQIIVTA
jgi:nitrite reductase (NO-forming)